MGCGCSERRQQAVKWAVVYPDGRTEPQNSFASAQMAQARVPGARLVKAS